MKKLAVLLASLLLMGSLQAAPIAYQKKFYNQDFKIKHNAKVALTALLFQEITKWEVEGDDYSYTYRFSCSRKNKKALEDMFTGTTASLNIAMDTSSVAKSDYVKEEEYTEETFMNYVNPYKLPFGALSGKRSNLIADIAEEVNFQYFYVIRFDYEISASAIKYTFVGKLYDNEGNLLYNRMLENESEPPKPDILKQDTADAYTESLLYGFRSLNQQFWKEIIE